MSIRELDPGQRHTMACTPYRVQLTGAETTALLKAVDQAGHESETVRLTDREIVLTPEPRRLRLVASPLGRTSFPAGTMLGLTIRTEGGGPAEQVIVSRVDVGALELHELAVLDFATERAVLSVTESNGVRPELHAPEDVYVSGTTVQRPSAVVQPSKAVDTRQHEWLQAGRYALRDAKKIGNPAPAVTSWGVVLDGSASMRALHDSGQLDALLHLACGVLVAWTSEWPKACVVAGLTPAPISNAVDDPTALSRAAFSHTEPSSWSHFTEAVKVVLAAVGRHGGVLLITDGVPGDLARLADLARANRGVRLVVLTIGTSRRGLSTDVDIDWWEEELEGMKPLDDVRNAAVVAIRSLPGDRLDLSGTRAAELALRVTGSASAVVGT